MITSLYIIPAAPLDRLYLLESLVTVSSLSGDVHALGREPETRGGDSLSPSTNGTGSLSRKSAYIYS